MTTLPPFPAPVHFMFRGRKPAWPDLFDGSPLPDPDAIPDRLIEVEECWVVHTFLRLRQAGLAATLSDGFREDAINVVSYHDLALKDFPALPFLVVAQADAARPELCDRVVVQNRLNLRRSTDDFIPHWPQPGLLTRDPGRGTRIETLGFKGSETNLYASFRSPEMLAALRERGVELVFDVKEMTARGAALKWNDYRACDLVLAVRDAPEHDLELKPASKLVNAWLAGVPALLGPEPAFQSLRRSELDYFEVRKPADVIAVIEKLKADPGLYEAIVRNGLARGADFTHPRVTARWHEVLSGPAARDFARWRALPQPVRRAARWALFGPRALLHVRNRKTYAANFDRGYRPISDRTT
jgi:hypothetical protein